MLIFRFKFILTELINICLCIDLDLITEFFVVGFIVYRLRSFTVKIC